MALTDTGYNPYLEKARVRLKQNPNADLRDIAIEMFDREEEIRGKYELSIWKNLVGNALFNGDYEAAKASLVKLTILRPPRQAVDVADANKVLINLSHACPWFDANKLAAEFDKEIRRR